MQILTMMGVINSSDETAIGRGIIPELTYGLNLSASWKGFDLSALFQGAADYSINLVGRLTDPFFNGGGVSTYFGDRWHHQDLFDPDSPWVPGKYPSTQLNGSANNNVTSSFWLVNVRYLRLKTLNLGYTINKELVKRIGFSNLRVYVSAQNLLTITNAPFDIDPESQNTAAYYPQQKVVTIGLQANFN